LEWQTGLCELPYGYLIDCLDYTPVVKTFNPGPTTSNADPFVVISSLTCGSLGMDDEVLGRLLGERLDAGAQGAIENIFSRQQVGQAPGLSNNAGAVTLTAAATLTAGIGALESWLAARYGPAGVIHVPAVAAYQLQSQGGLRFDGRVWRTPMGTAVSFGNYAGRTTADAAPAAGHTTLYITGQVTIWQSPNTFITPFREALNRATNQVNAFAERVYLMGYDCFVAAVDVTL
jgi:hypothetical protein